MSPKKKSKRKNNDSKRLGEFVETGHKLTQQELESHLWESANILRGSIDAADYKNYIFGLLFLKRLSDVFVEEAERIEKETGNKNLAWEDPDEHQFFVPKRARWSELRKIAHDLGDAINKANEALEEANPQKLERVLANINFNDKERLPDAILLQLLDHFSRFRLRNEDLSEPDLLGRAYEYLIAQFADDAGKKGGEFYTPRKVVELIVRLIKPKEGMRICDPACGSGGMLIECAKYISEQGGNPLNISLYGQEKNINTWAICKMNMLLHGLVDAHIERGDSIRDPKLVKDGELLLFEQVIANPPFSLKNWGYEDVQKDGFGRFQYGLPPKKSGDFAFIQHMISTMSNKGIVGVVMPHGALFRGNIEGRIRKGILEDDLVDGVIGLSPNLFYGTGIPACIIILRRDKPESHNNKVLIIDGSREYIEKKPKNALSDANVTRLSTAYYQYKNQEKFCRIVDLDEIRSNKYNLNIGLYVDSAPDEIEIRIEEVITEIKRIEEKRKTSLEKLEKDLHTIGIKW